MGSVKDFVLIAGGIASAALSGGTTSAILAGIAAVSKHLGGKEPSLSDPKTAWTVDSIQIWMGIALDNMQRPMAEGLKGELLRKKIAADWFSRFGTKASKSWVNQMAEQSWNAVKTNIALGLIIAPTHAQE
jgi:hypothetical protein